LLDSTLTRLENFAADAGATCMDAALMVNRCVDEALDPLPVAASLAALADRYTGRGTPWEFLRAEGFGGGAPADVIAGSRVDTLLETRRGLPITLAALLVYVAGRAGLPAVGINFPGHFLARVDGVLVDPFALEARTEAECLATLPPESAESDALQTADARDVLLRMFNNLKYFHLSRAEFHRALEMVDCQLRVLPGHAGLVFEQGEYWLRLGSAEGARAAFERILAGRDVNVDPAVRRMAQRRLDELGDRRDTLH
jgi:regulator of sirC expression with transglutaminase-like and TPR domain